jgi:hypothetical protein
MKKDLTSLLLAALCAVTLLPALSRAQNPTAEMHGFPIAQPFEPATVQHRVVNEPRCFRNGPCKFFPLDTPVSRNGDRSNLYEAVDLASPTR